jgi:hypothetical protein
MTRLPQSSSTTLYVVGRQIVGARHPIADWAGMPSPAPSEVSVARRGPATAAGEGRPCAESVRPCPVYPGALPRAPAPLERLME